MWVIHTAIRAPMDSWLIRMVRLYIHSVLRPDLYTGTRIIAENYGYYNYSPKRTEFSSSPSWCFNLMIQGKIWLFGNGRGDVVLQNFRWKLRFSINMSYCNDEASLVRHHLHGCSDTGNIFAPAPNGIWIPGIYTTDHPKFSGNSLLQFYQHMRAFLLIAPFSRVSGATH